MIAKSSDVEIKSQLTGAIIKPYGKYLDINYFTPQNNHNRVFCFHREHLQDMRKKKKEYICKKKTLLLESLSGLLNRVFPCFHCFSKTSPSHTLKLPQRNFFRGREE